MPDPRTYILELDPALRPPPQPIAEHIADDFDWFGTYRASARPDDPLSAIEGIVIHATAGSTAAGALSWWRNPKVRASAHWLIPAEREALHGKAVIAAVPETRAAWHVLPDCAHPAINGGKARINSWSLGIEIVNTQNPDDPFSDWQIEATAATVRYAWAKYPNLRWLFSHAAVDPKRRSDPGAGFDWEGFVGRVIG
jgi:N-acetyl-anhydromuramyl-L-alanine amidase AmpD